MTEGLSIRIEDDSSPDTDVLADAAGSPWNSLAFALLQRACGQTTRFLVAEREVAKVIAAAAMWEVRRLRAVEAAWSTRLPRLPVLACPSVEHPKRRIRHSCPGGRIS